MSIYRRSLKESLKLLSSFLNRKRENYEFKMANLKNLISTGKTDGKIVDQLNNSLISSLSELSSHSRIKVKIQSNYDEFLDLMNQLEEMVNKFDHHDDDILSTPNNKRLKESIISLYEDGMMGVLSKDIIKIHIPTGKFPIEIIREYINNYFNLSNIKEKEVSFSEDVLIQYLHHLEGKVDTSKETAEVYKEINQYLKIKIENASPEIRMEIPSITAYKIFLHRVKNIFSWIKDGDTDIKNEQLIQFKEEIRKKVVALAIKANTEIFPTLLKEEILDRQSSNKDSVSKLINVISSLENERRYLLNTLNSEQLDDYSFFGPVQKELLSINDFKDSLLACGKIFDPDHLECILKKFLEKRNKIEDQIKKQIDDNEESYLSVKNGIDGIEEENDDDLIVCFINSVRQFQEELSESVLGDLSYTFQEAKSHGSYIFEIRNDAIKKLNEIKKNEKASKTEETANISLRLALKSYIFPTKYARQCLSCIDDFEELKFDVLFESIKDYANNLSHEELFEEEELDQDYLETLAEYKGKINIGEAVAGLDILQEVLDNSELQDLIKKIPVFGTGLSLISTSYSIGKIFADARKHTKVMEEEIYHLQVKIITQIATRIIKDSFKNQGYL